MVSKRTDDFAAGHDGARSPPRLRAVRLSAFDDDFEAVAGGHKGAAAPADRPGFHAGKHMESEYRVDLRRVEYAFFHHEFGAGGLLGERHAFFRGLEDQQDLSGRSFFTATNDFAAVRSIAVWASWPQACMTPTVFPSHVVVSLLANGRSTSSVTGSASMSGAQCHGRTGEAALDHRDDPVAAMPVFGLSPISRRRSAM
jgi:hypothetical protein